MSRLNFAGQDDLRQLQQLSTPVWIFDVDRHGIWWANTQGLTFWKAANVEELRSRDFSSDSATVRERLRQIVDLAGTDTHVTDTWTLYPSGNPETVILSFQPVEIETRFKGIMIELIQVLDRDADDDTWRLLEAARATSLIMTTFSMDGHLLTQNPASLACYGAVVSAGEGKADLQSRFKDPSMADQVLKNASSNETANLEAVVLTVGGERTHSLSVRRGRDPITGDFVTVLSEEDITERAKLRRIAETEKEALKHEVEESSDKLRISQERYELAVQTAAIWDWDVEADRLFMSPNFVAQLGYTKEEFKDVLRTKQFRSFVHPDDIAAYEATIKKHLAGSSPTLSIELRCLTKTGDVLWFHCQGNGVYDENGIIMRSVGLLSDITHRKNLEEKLLASQRMEAIGQLTGGIAHDFNNLLTVIQGNAELLKETDVPDTELTGEIVEAVRRGADLTKHLLAFARQQTLIPRSVDLTQLIPEMEKTLLRTISETVTIECRAQSGLWNVRADQTQLETAILNLALNARDAMPSGGTISIECNNMEVGLKNRPKECELTPGKYVQISIGDTGLGMTEGEVRKAFEPFYTTKSVGQGSGLGLSMVLGFSRQSGGDACISSGPNGGTTVAICLPKATASDLRPINAPSAKIQPGNRERIHILEDNQHVQQAVSKLVSSLGYQVSTSDDARDALDWVASNPQADVYLVDILLPGGQSGVDFARALRRLRPTANIVFMSGYSDNQLIEGSGLEAGSHFIPKPFDRVKISEVLKLALGAKPHKADA